MIKPKMPQAGGLSEVAFTSADARFIVSGSATASESGVSLKLRQSIFQTGEWEGVEILPRRRSDFSRERCDE